MPQGAGKKDVDFFASGLTFIQSQVSPISQYCGSDRLFCGPTISFTSPQT